MSIILKFELIETFPLLKEIDSDESDLKILFNYESQIVEENAIAMLNKIETSPLAIKLNQKSKEIKIIVRLMRGHDIYGSGELILPLSVINAKELNMKKWINLNTPTTKAKKTDSSAFLNKIKLNINIMIGYIHADKAPYNPNTPKVTRSGSISSLNRSVTDHMPRQALSPIRNMSHKNNETHDFINSYQEDGQRFKQPGNQMLLNSPSTKAELNRLDDFNSITYDDIDLTATNKFSSLNLYNEVEFGTNNNDNQNLERQLKFLQSQIEDEKQLQVEKASKKKKVDFDTSFEHSLIENSKIRNKKHVLDKNEDLINSVIRNEIMYDETKEIPKSKEQLEDSIDENFVFDYDINREMEFDDEINAFEESLIEFKMYYNKNLFRALPVEDSYLRFELTGLQEKFSEFQETYYTKLKELILCHHKMKKFSLNNYDRYRGIKKKMKELKDRIETFKDVSEIKEFNIMRQNDFINSVISTSHSEANTMKYLLNINYNKNDIENYAGIHKVEKAGIKKTLLNLSYKIFSKGENFNVCSDATKFMIRKILGKNGMILPDGIEKEEVKRIPKLADNNSNDTVDDSIREEKINKLLQHEMNDFYSKKKITRVEFQKLQDGSYKFGTQKVFISLEDDNIFVKSGDNMFKLETFLDFYSIIEGKKVKSIAEDTSNSSRIPKKANTIKTDKVPNLLSTRKSSVVSLKASVTSLRPSVAPVRPSVTSLKTSVASLKPLKKK